MNQELETRYIGFLIQQANFFIGLIWWNEDIAAWTGTASHPSASVRYAMRTKTLTRACLWVGVRAF